MCVGQSYLMVRSGWSVIDSSAVSHSYSPLTTPKSACWISSFHLRCVDGTHLYICSFPTYSLRPKFTSPVHMAFWASLCSETPNSIFIALVHSAPSISPVSSDRCRWSSQSEHYFVTLKKSVLYCLHMPRSESEPRRLLVLFSEHQADRFGHLGRIESKAFGYSVIRT